MAVLVAVLGGVCPGRGWSLSAAVAGVVTPPAERCRPPPSQHAVPARTYGTGQRGLARGWSWDMGRPGEVRSSKLSQVSGGFP